MKRSKQCFMIAAAIVCCALSAQAADKDDFGRIVHHIETQYHVHRQHRFAMGFAGFVVKFWHVAGVKSLKGAIFENQPFLNAGADRKFDEVVRAAMDSGWQPMVQSWDRHSGERTYIYAQEVSSKNGKDMKVLIVNLESNEAVVLQVKINPEKLNEFAREASAGRNHHDEPVAKPMQSEPRIEAASIPQNWDGVCLSVDEGLRPIQPFEINP
jgi:hypothetical protein